MSPGPFATQLSQTSDQIRQKGLSKKQTNRVRHASAVMTTDMTTARKGRPKRYQNILRQVLEEAGPGAVLLCAATFGIVFLSDRLKEIRAALLSHLGSSCIEPFIDELSIQYQIPQSQSDMPPPPSSQSNPPAQPVGVSFRLATLDGVATVFNEYLCGAIRRTEGELICAVRMDFPPWSDSQQCLMSLDIYPQYIDPLAMALFGVQITRAGDVPHLPEYTIQGSKDEAIVNVFSEEIRLLTTETLIRREELAAGKVLTNCVSMTVTGIRAMIKLFLGVKGGIRLAKRLYV